MNDIPHKGMKRFWFLPAPKAAGLNRKQGRVKGIFSEPAISLILIKAKI
jgi:hypothetical protein